MLVHCEGKIETDPRATDVNWMIIKQSFMLPGRFGHEAWVGAPGNYNLSEALHVPPTENGNFHILGYDFSNDKRDLTLRYRYDAKQGVYKDSESALVLCLSESGDSLVLKQGLSVVHISPLYIKALVRPQR